jgi:phosphate transport system substrate-binding protein
MGLLDIDVGRLQSTVEVCNSMNRRLKRMGVVGAAGAAALVASLTVSPVPAFAAAWAPLNPASEVINIVGSDTTFDFMDDYVANWVADAAENVGPTPDVVRNTSPLLPPFPPNTTVTIPSDPACPTGVTYDTDPATPPPSPPNGSGQGRTALFAATNQSTACVDIARASNGRAAGNPANSENWGFGRDAVGFVTFNGTTQVNLTQAQIRDIYDCDIKRWQDIPGSGKTGDIIRYYIQAGSGTRDFFQTTVLGFDPTLPIAACTGTPTPTPILLQENNASPIAAANQARAILPYSAGKWVCQKRFSVPGAQCTTDLTAGSMIGLINSRNPITGSGTSVALNNSTVGLNSLTPFLAARTINNVLWQSLPSYDATLRMVGVRPLPAGGKSKLCDGRSAALITAHGFLPIPNGVTFATNPSLYENSTCRLS